MRPRGARARWHGKRDVGRWVDAREGGGGERIDGEKVANQIEGKRKKKEKGES